MRHCCCGKLQRRLVVAAIAAALLTASCDAQFDQPCVETPPLAIEPVSAPAVCMNGLNGYNTVATALFTYKASFVGNEDTSPSFEIFLDGDSKACSEQSNRSMDGSELTALMSVTCVGTLQAGSHEIQVVGAFDGGQQSCASKNAENSIRFRVDAPAAIELIAPLPSEVCYGSTSFTLTYGYIKSASVVGVPMNYWASWEFPDGTTGGMCSAAEAGTGIQVTCSSDTGFQTGSMLVKLYAELPEGTIPGSACTDPLITNEVRAQVTVRPQPTLQIVPMETRPVCVNTKKATLKFEYRLKEAGQTASIEALTPMAQMYGGNIVAPQAQDCSTLVEETGYNTYLKEGTGILTVTCQGAYTELAASLDVKASMHATCSSGITTVGPNSALTAASVQAERVVPAGAEFKPAGAAVVVSSSPVITAESIVTKPLTCCLGGARVAVYAKSDPGTRPSKCFKDGPTLSGLYNRGEAKGKLVIVPQVARPTATPRCSPATITVGDVEAKCDYSVYKGNGALRLKLMNYNKDTVERWRFLFSCKDPRTSNLRPSTIDMLPDPVTDYWGTWLSLPVQAVGCKCRDLYWAVYQAGTYRDVGDQYCVKPSPTGRRLKF